VTSSSASTDRAATCWTSVHSPCTAGALRRKRQSASLPCSTTAHTTVAPRTSARRYVPAPTLDRGTPLVLSPRRSAPHDPQAARYFPA
jgi:hypothetical protein